MEGWDPEGYRQWLIEHFPVTFEEHYFDDDHKDVADLEKMASEKIIKAFKEKLDRENNKTPPAPDPKTGVIFKPANEAIRNLMIRRIDQLWQEHLLRMDHLRSDVNVAHCRPARSSDRIQA